MLVKLAGARGLGALLPQDAELLCVGLSVSGALVGDLSLSDPTSRSYLTFVQDGAPFVRRPLIGI